MSTVALILGVFIVCLIVLDRIPGVRHLISPVVSGAGSAITVIAGSTTAWVAWSIKTVWRDHLTVLRNLTARRADIDPTDPYR